MLHFSRQTHKPIPANLIFERHLGCKQATSIGVGVGGYPWMTRRADLRRITPRRAVDSEGAPSSGTTRVRVKAPWQRLGSRMKPRLPA